MHQLCIKAYTVLCMHSIMHAVRIELQVPACIARSRNWDWDWSKLGAFSCQPSAHHVSGAEDPLQRDCRNYPTFDGVLQIVQLHTRVLHGHTRSGRKKEPSAWRLRRLFCILCLCKSRAAAEAPVRGGRWREGVRKKAKSFVLPLPPTTKAKAKGKCLSRREVRIYMHYGRSLQNCRYAHGAAHSAACMHRCRLKASNALQSSDYLRKVSCISCLRSSPLQSSWLDDAVSAYSLICTIFAVHVRTYDFQRLHSIWMKHAETPLQLCTHASMHMSCMQ